MVRAPFRGIMSDPPLASAVSQRSSTLRMEAVRVTASSRQLDTPLRPAPPLPTGDAHATITLMTGVDAGKIVSVERDVTVIGRDPVADLFLDDAAVSRWHARITRAPGREFVLEDVGSTNGTWVSGRRVSSAILAPGDHVQIGPNVLLRFALYDDRDESLHRRLFESSVRDPLSGAFNRRYFSARLVAEASYARRTGAHLSVLMLDVDHFKKLNDEFGHVVGDRVLRTVAEQMRQVVRAEDVVARYGGDEFVVLVRSAGLEQARELAERLRDTLRHQTLHVGSEAVSVTVSAGVASLDEVDPDERPWEVIAHADARLYRAKAEGRDRVCAAG